MCHWHKERREVELPTDDDTTPPCVKLHGILPAPRVPPVLTQEPVLVNRIGERVWLPLPGLRQSVCRAEFLAVAACLRRVPPARGGKRLQRCGQNRPGLTNRAAYAQRAPQRSRIQNFECAFAWPKNQ
eukprot:2440196-Amphidinium_carterae.1